MGGRLCLLCCESFRPEVEAAVAAEGWTDVAVAAFPVRCGHPPMTWDELRAVSLADCTQAIVLGRACLHGLGTPPADWPPVRQLQHDQCFELVAGPTQVAGIIDRDGYLMTPGWLADWRGNLARMGFAEQDAAGFFHEFARELVLLDTGLRSDAQRQLEELAAAAGLPASRVAVGIDYTRLVLARLVAEWRQEQAETEARQCRQEHARDRADHLAATDFLAGLVLHKDEPETIEAIKDLLRMLFAPEVIHYVRIADGVAEGIEALPADLANAVRNLDRDWAWTASGSGFLARIGTSGETMGIVVADRFAFPEFRERYLGVALSLAGVCALAIENARSFRRIREAEDNLRKSERSLLMAQAIAHLGHWEWQVGSGSMQWSDETYRIFGYTPQTLTPSRDVFFQVIHPADRARVAEALDTANEGGNFNVEYRIVLPDGGVRVVHGVGEIVILGGDRDPNVIGTIRDVTAERPTGAVLGVVQDITERKQLELRLEKEARTDALTGCANRRHFMELAAHELARMRRYGGELSLLMLDLDHFKAINDRHGHAVGDQALQTLVQVCQAALREEDVVGRLGGEEFAVLLPETGRDRAMEVGERLRAAIAAAPVPLEGKPPLRFTTSVGVARLEPTDLAVEVVLSRADQALYRAKETGRNRVVAA